METELAITGADIEVVITGAVVTGAVVTGAVVTGAVVTGAVVTGAVVTGAVVTGAATAPCVPMIASDRITTKMEIIFRGRFFILNPFEDFVQNRFKL
jgi:hypothetical protein